MTISQFINNLREQPDTIAFEDTMQIIEEHYNFTPSAFKNGDVANKNGENSGSCKLFSFAHLHDLNKEETLSCFGQYYTDVQQTPQGNDHQNIRNFIKTGWDGISFESRALTKK